MSPVVESRLWTSDEEERLRALVVSGKHPAANGKLLRRSEKAIRNRLHRLGVPKRINVELKAKGNEMLAMCPRRNRAFVPSMEQHI